MDKPIIARRVGGEYSTVALPNGVIETMWFGDDGSTRTVGRTYPPSIKDIAAQHIESDKAR